MKTVMVVDDEKNIRDSLEGILRDEGYEVITSRSAEDALEKLSEAAVDAALLDVWMDGMDGVEALKEIKKLYPALPVIMISGHGTIETAVKATKLGAYDFLEKPLTLEKVILSVEHAIEQKRLIDENILLRQGARNKYEILGVSRAMEMLRKDISQVAPSDSWVLITGENGTGKELVARNIHILSGRSDKPFVAVNCAAIPEELIESELFGYEKGAFTGAAASKKGRFDMADKGTIFLDEIGDMSLKTQAKVLRILEEKNFERVGGVKTVEVNVRVIAATNKDIKEEIKTNRFREDLYYRLNVIPFHLPSLRERPEDVPVFVNYFLKEFSLETTKEIFKITKDAMKILCNYNWPGNVREVKNLIERLIIMTPKGTITGDVLPPYIKGEAGQGVKMPFKNTIKEAREEFEREFIVKKLAENNGNIANTALAIGMERSHLYRKIKHYGIETD